MTHVRCRGVPRVCLVSALVCGDVRCGRVAATHVATRIDVDAPTREYRIRSFARARALFAPLDRAFIVLGEGRTFIHFVI
jgi:hypothetical protein